MFAKTISPAARRLVREMHPRTVMVVAVGTARADKAVRLAVPIQVLDHGVGDCVDNRLARLTMYADLGFVGYIVPLIRNMLAFVFAYKTCKYGQRIAPLRMMLRQAA